MVISKLLAKRISYKITEKEKESLKVAREQFEKEVINVYKSLLPEEVVAFSDKHPEFFKFSGDIKVVDGRDVEWIGIPHDEDVVLCNNDGLAVLRLKDKLCKTVRTLKRNYEKQKITYNKTRYQTEQLLLDLKTYKKILAELPMVAEHLPEKQVKEIKLQQTQPANAKRLKKKLIQLNLK